MSRGRGPGVAHAERRRELIEAAEAITAERGVTAVTLAAVAERAGVSPGRVQYYFPTKDDLLSGVLDEVNVVSSERVRAMVGEDLDRAEPRTVLEAVLTELIPADRSGRAHVQFRRGYMALATQHQGIADKLQELYRRLHHFELAELIEREREQGRVDAAVEPLAAAIGLAALGEGLAHYVVIGVADVERARALALDALDRLYAAPEHGDVPAGDAAGTLGTSR